VDTMPPGEDWLSAASPLGLRDLRPPRVPVGPRLIGTRDAHQPRLVENARATRLRPVGSPARPKPFGSEIAGTPTTLLEPISDTPPRTSGYASRNGLSIGLATVVRVGVAMASNGLSSSSYARPMRRRTRSARR